MSDRRLVSYELVNIDPALGGDEIAIRDPLAATYPSGGLSAIPYPKSGNVRVGGDTFRSGEKRLDHVRRCTRLGDLAWSANRIVNTHRSEIPIHLPHFIANIFLGTFAG